MSDNQIDNSSKIETIIFEMKEIKKTISEIERTLQVIRDNTLALAEIKAYLYELKNK